MRVQVQAANAVRAITYPLGEEQALWPEGGNRLFVLNDTAQIIWEGHHAGLSAVAIAKRLARRFAVPPEQAEQDTRMALAQWHQDGLLGGTGHAPQEQQKDDAPERLPPLPLPVAEHNYRLGGLILRVRVGDASLSQILLPLLQHLTVAPTTPADTVFDLAPDPCGFGYLLGQDGCVLACNLRQDDSITHLLYHLLAYPCSGTLALAVLHAAAVADGDSCLIMAAPGGSGKTTLTAALLAEGWDYLGDDMILLSRDEPPRTWPLPGPLCLKAGSWPVLKPYYLNLDTWPVLQRWDQPVRYLPPPQPSPDRAWPIRGLIFPAYQPGHSTTLESLTASAALQLLIAANVRWRLPLTAHDIGVLIDWLNRLPAYRLIYDILSEAVAAVRIVGTAS